MEIIHLCLFLMLCLGVHRSSSEILTRRKRNWIIDSFSIDEGYNGSFPYKLGKIEVEKAFTFFQIHGQGVDKDPKGTLQINKDTGEITVHRPVDCETYRELKLTFQALDKAQHVIDTQLGIEILIKDANDNPPKFDREQYEVSIKESTSQGFAVVTVRATDRDVTKENNMFDFKMVSVTPKPSDLEFYLKQVDQTATISFKGCLDHEKVDKYTIIVEAKDHGKIQLSSSCTIIINIEDGNNHLPVIMGQTGPGRVKEGEENVLVKRLQVADEDSRGTPAWRTKFQIHGDTNNNFRITTDPETNEGLLFVEKHLNYEDSPVTNVSISVTNEIPYHMCKVVSRTATGLWTVDTTGDATGTRVSTSRVTVIVEDVNEPPVFDTPNKHVTVSENVEVGHYLVAFTATDPDTSSATTFVYKTGDDPAGWVTVDSKTGKITTSKIIDRESSFVKNNDYNVTICAVDSGRPPMTGTATLYIHITDENDNIPLLSESTIDVCQTNGHSVANITAVDLDEEPYSGPFSFKLKGDVEGKWKLDPTQGYTVDLVKEHVVHSGHYVLFLEVLDLQGMGAVHNLSVTVCDCADTARPNCRIRKATASTLGGGAIGIFFLSMLLLAGVLLTVCLVSCKKENKMIVDDCDSGQHLMNCNIEKPGTDCTVAFEPFIKEKIPATKEAANQYGTSPAWGASNGHKGSQHTISQADFIKQRREYTQWLASRSTVGQNFVRGSSMRSSMGAFTMGSQHRNSVRKTRTRQRRHSADSDMLYTLEAPTQELGDYAPHVYAEEGDAKTSLELDAISIPNIPFDPDLDLDLDFKFNTLASICMPSESTTYSTNLLLKDFRQ